MWLVVSVKQSLSGLEAYINNQFATEVKRYRSNNLLFHL
jgi:hypothetical protein